MRRRGFETSLTGRKRVRAEGSFVISSMQISMFPVQRRRGPLLCQNRAGSLKYCLSFVSLSLRSALCGHYQVVIDVKAC